MKYRVIAFDYDGTLVDTFRFHVNTIGSVCSKIASRGIPTSRAISSFEAHAPHSLTILPIVFTWGSVIEIKKII